MYVNHLKNLHRIEATISERYLGGSVSHQENYIMSKIDGFIQKIKNDTLLVMDSYPFNPVQHFQTTKLSQKLIKAGTRFQHKVKHTLQIIRKLSRFCILKFQVYHEVNKELIEYHFYLSLEHFITHCV